MASSGCQVPRDGSCSPALGRHRLSFQARSWLAAAHLGGTCRKQGFLTSDDSPTATAGRHYDCDAGPVTATRAGPGVVAIHIHQPVQQSAPKRIKAQGGAGEAGEAKLRARRRASVGQFHRHSFTPHGPQNIAALPVRIPASAFGFRPVTLEAGQHLPPC